MEWIMSFIGKLGAVAFGVIVSGAVMAQESFDFVIGSDSKEPTYVSASIVEDKGSNLKANVYIDAGGGLTKSLEGAVVFLALYNINCDTHLFYPSQIQIYSQDSEKEGLREVMNMDVDAAQNLHGWEMLKGLRGFQNVLVVDTWEDFINDMGRTTALTMLRALNTSAIIKVCEYAKDKEDR